MNFSFDGANGATSISERWLYEARVVHRAYWTDFWTRSSVVLGDSQLEAVSYGKERPAVDGHDEAAWAKNRRVELRSK